MVSRLAAVIVVLAAAFLPSALRSEESSLERVTLQLKWKHQFQFAGYYVALEKGFYRQAGLDVQVVEGGPGRDPYLDVMANRAQYGVGDSSLLLHRLKGKSLVALAALFQHSANVFLTLWDSGIASPQDMIGRRIMMLPELGSAEFKAVFLSEGISLDLIEQIPTSFDVEDLIAGNTDAFNAYITNEPYALERMGIGTTVIKPRTYGIDFYGDTLFTSEGELEQHPERVGAFLEASLRGWEYAMNHPGEAAELIVAEYAPKKSADQLLLEAKEMRKLILPDLIELGHMNPGRWRHIADTYVELDMAAPGYSLEGFLYQRYPNLYVKWFRWALYILLAVFALGCLVTAWNARLRQVIKKLRESEEALRESEERFSTAFRASPSMFVITDPAQGLTVDVSESCVEILGYKREEMIGKTAAELKVWADPDDRRRFIDRFRRDGLVRNFETRIRTKNGDLRIVEMSAEHIEVAGKPQMLLAAHDVTERKVIEEQLRKAHDGLELTIQERTRELSESMIEAKVANRAKSNLMANMSHELRTPLNAIIGFSSTMRSETFGSLNEKYLEYANDIHSSGEHLLELINDILDVSAIEAGKLEFQEENLDVGKVVEATMHMVKERAFEGNIHLTGNTEGGLPMLYADRRRLMQILLNLLSNAIKFTLPDGEVSLTASLDGGDAHVFTVRDTGVGMEEEEQAKAISMFGQVDSGLARKHEGTGLGLPLSHRLVELHGGTLEIDSEKGGGTTVTVRFPSARTVAS